jgi:hypothetical protein
MKEQVEPCWFDAFVTRKNCGSGSPYEPVGISVLPLYLRKSLIYPLLRNLKAAPKFGTIKIYLELVKCK